MASNGEMAVVNDRRIGALGDFVVLPDEVICSLLSLLSPPDIARLSCVSSVMYIFCNEEPLWMSLCLNSANGLLEYNGSWKKTAVLRENAIKGDIQFPKKTLHFDGFYSLFLYRRLYRCYTSLDGFCVDNGNVEKKSNLSFEEFHNEYDGKRPVLITGLADSWAARKTWTVDQLLLKYGDTPFKISQQNANKIKMKFKDYISYTKVQHDEDPLYIFDPKFGEVTPDLLKDYDVPHLFREDFFDILSNDQRPPFRWLIIGPERSGASWHIDPALTSAWNTLLCGRKRWALYPPGKVPAGVIVHVNDDDGDVDIQTPSSLQWWLEFYPFLQDEDKPIECIQMPGETIFVPSGWWHCVLNLETSIAVTQNFVNSTNFEFVCLDMAPGYRHKGVCRAGWLALADANSDDVDEIMHCARTCSNSAEAPRKEKRPRKDNACHEGDKGHGPDCSDLWNHELPYDINFFSKLLEEDRDHYNSTWSSSNCIGQREMRDWLRKLWIAKPEMRDLIWKGACIALNAGRWYECIGQICRFHHLPFAEDDERLPVGTGSNPVYLIAENVIKIYVEGGLESALYSLGTELEFYNLMCRVKSNLKDHVPDILASGLVYLENGCYTVIPWDGEGVPDVITDYSHSTEKCKNYSTPFGLWSKMLFACQKPDLSTCKPISPPGSKKIYPYIVTKRCEGEIFAEVRESLLVKDTLNLASFIGEQLHNLHVLPVPEVDNQVLADIKVELGFSPSCNVMEVGSGTSPCTTKWATFLYTLKVRRKDVMSRLTGWGDPIPSSLIDKVDEYLPDDLETLISAFEGETCSWIHSDIMDDNIHMEPSSTTSTNGNSINGELESWKASHLLDFSDLSIGDPILDLIPIHLDVFKGDQQLLEALMSSYKLPLLNMNSKYDQSDKVVKFKKASYRAMCYCILHEDNVLGAIFSGWEELKMAKSWEEVEDNVWGILNNYTS